MEAPALTSPPPSLPVDVCPNCGAERLGPYCQTCGQHYQEAGRLTLRGLWRDFAERFLKLEQGLWFTVRSLTLQPGRVALDYVSGRRRRYISPLGYLLLATSLSVLLYPLYDDLVRAQMEAGAAWGIATSPDPGADLDPEKRERVDLFMAIYTEKLLESITRFATLFSIALGGILALFLRLLHGRRYNVAEHAVLALYVAGHYTLITSVLGPLIYRAPATGSMLIGLGLLLGLLVWGALAFYGRRWKTVGLTLAAFVPSYVCYLLVVILIAGIYSGWYAAQEVEGLF